MLTPHNRNFWRTVVWTSILSTMCDSFADKTKSTVAQVSPSPLDSLLGKLGLFVTSCWREEPRMWLFSRLPRVVRCVPSFRSFCSEAAAVATVRNAIAEYTAAVSEFAQAPLQPSGPCGREREVFVNHEVRCAQCIALSFFLSRLSAQDGPHRRRWLRFGLHACIIQRENAGISL